MHYQKHSEESKEKMRKSHKIHPSSNLGKHWNIKDTSKMNLDKIGKKRPPRSEEWKRKIKEARKKQIITPEHRRNIGRSESGEKHWNWQGGKSSINHGLRNSVEYKLWRESVFKRDNYTCIWCGRRGGRLNADHIKSWALYPALRFAIDNGRTLCLECHKTTENYLINIKKKKL